MLAKNLANRDEQRDGAQFATVALIEDQRAFAEAMVLALSMTTDLRITGTASDAATGFEMVLATAPDLVVADYRLSGRDTGIDLARRLRDRDSDMIQKPSSVTPIVILTGYTAPQVVREAESLRSVSVLSKNSPIADLVKQFRRTIVGEAVNSVSAVDPFGLTKAELEVLELLSQAMSASEIADHLFLSLHAIRARIKSALRKLDVSSQLEAVVKATSLDLLVPPARSSGEGQDDRQH
ncbi:MAG: response regulator transcription factor [Acidimicrobiales bacterium]